MLPPLPAAVGLAALRRPDSGYKPTPRTIPPTPHSGPPLKTSEANSKQSEDNHLKASSRSKERGS